LIPPKRLIEQGQLSGQTSLGSNWQWFLVFRVRRLVAREAVTVVTLANDLLSGNGPGVTVVTLKTGIDDYLTWVI
jgi:hypothetical protein